MSKQLAICGATVIDTYTGAKDIRDILIEGERVAAIGPVGSIEIPAETETVDARGRYLIPGLWDAHIHLTVWPEIEENISALLTAYGITSVRDMGAKLDNILAFRKKAMQKEALAPRIWFAGPFINSSPVWATNKNSISVEVDTQEEAFNLVDALAEAGVHLIKPYETLLPEAFEALVKRAKKHGLKVAGHAPMSLTLPELLDIIPDYDIQHLGGDSGMKIGCDCLGEQIHRDRVALLEANRATAETGVELLYGVVEALQASPDKQDPDKRSALIELFIEKGTWHTPTLVVTMSLANLGFDDHPERVEALQYLPKAILKKWQEVFNTYKGMFEARYRWDSWYIETVGLMHKAGIPMLAGTDSPPSGDYTPGSALHFELQALVQAGLSPLAALQTATLNPAKFFEIEHDFGSIAKGKFADLLLLEKDPLEDIRNTRSIVSVLSRGHYLDRQALDDLFASMTEETLVEESA